MLDDEIVLKDCSIGGPLDWKEALFSHFDVNYNDYVALLLAIFLYDNVIIVQHA